MFSDRPMTYHDRDSVRSASDAPQERRPRSSTFLGAELHWPANERRAQVRDLSETGALVVTEAPPAPGTRVLLLRGEHRLHAQVVWSSGHRCGLRFDHSVSVAEVIRGSLLQNKAGVTPAAAASGSSDPLDTICEQANRIALALAGGESDGVDLHAQALELVHLLRRFRAGRDGR